MLAAILPWGLHRQAIVLWDKSNIEAFNLDKPSIGSFTWSNGDPRSTGRAGILIINGGITSTSNVLGTMRAGIRTYTIENQLMLCVLTHKSLRRLTAISINQRRGRGISGHLDAIVGFTILAS